MIYTRGKGAFGKGDGTGYGRGRHYTSYSYGDLFDDGMPHESMVAAGNYAFLGGLCKGDSPGREDCYDTRRHKHVVEFG